MHISIYTRTDDGLERLHDVEVRGFSVTGGRDLSYFRVDGVLINGAAVVWTADPLHDLCIVEEGIGSDRGHDLVICRQRWKIIGFDCANYKLYLDDADGWKKGA